MSTGVKSIAMGTILAAVVLCGAPVVQSQQVIMKSSKGGPEGGEIGMLREVGGALMEEDGKLKFLMVMSPDQRPAAYKSVNLKQDDILLMFNGKRLKAVADLTKAYEALKPGDEMKLGIRRGADMRIVSMVKADPDDLPKMQMKTMTVGADDGESWASAETSLDGVTLTVLEGSGLLAKQDEDAIVVAMLMPDAKDILGSVEVHEGDRFISLQGKDLTSAEMLGELFDAIPAGDTVTLVLERDDKQYTASFEKREAQLKPRMIIRKQ